jgi:hypothetical protein
MDINDAFKFTSKMVFGQEIGELNDYDGYFREALAGKEEVSHFSKNKIFLTSDQYCKGAKFFDFEKEQAQMAKALAKPLSINEIKDIDSLFRAVGEKLIYSGNKVLGNSRFVVDSDNVVDGMHVLNSSQVFSSKYIAYSYGIRKCDYTFATTSSGECAATIRCFYNNNLRRSFECAYGVRSSDSHFCYKIIGCNECMFTFNVNSKRYVIGNIQLEPMVYAELKKKLIGEVIDELKMRKQLPFSIINIHKAEVP